MLPQLSSTSTPPILPPLPKADDSPPRRWIWLGALGLVAAVALAYSNAFTVPFLFDDEGSILGNESIRSWRTVLFPRGDTGDTVGGRPLLNISLAINYAISGRSVWSYHLVNILIHLVTGLALFGLVRRTLAGRGEAGVGFGAGAGAGPGVAWRGREAFFCALAVAGLWMLHPLQTESVTYIVQRAESLMSMLYVLTLYCFSRIAECGMRSAELQTTAGHDAPRASANSAIRIPQSAFFWLVLSVVFCALGMASKEVMVSAPVMVLLYDRAFVSGSFAAAWRARWRFYLVLCATWLVLAACLINSGFRGGTAGYSTPVTWWIYAITQCKAILIYLKLVFWPSPLVFDYGVFFIMSPWDVLWQICAVVLLAAAALFAMFRFPRAGFFGAVFFAVLAPSSSFIPVVSQTMAEHRMYLPSAAIIAGVVVACWWFARRRAPGLAKNARIAGVAACAIALVFGVVTWKRNQVFQTVVSIWRDTVNKAPSSHRAQNNMGCALIDAKKYEEGIPYCLEATRLKPDYGEAYGNVGYGLSGEKKFAEAIPYYEQALFYMRKIGLTNLDRVLLNYGLALHEMARDTEARAVFEEAIAANPKNAPSLNNIGNYEFLAGRYAEAKKYYERAVDADPDFAEAWYDLGNAAVALGQQANDETKLRESFAEAEQHYRHALQISPDLTLAQDNLARLLLAMGRAEEASAYFEKVLNDKDNPGGASPTAQLSAAKAYLQLGKTAEAIALLEAVLRQDPGNTEATYLLGDIHNRMGDKQGTSATSVSFATVPNKADPSPDTVAKLSAAKNFMQTGKTADAIPLLETLVQQDANNIEATYLLGNARYRMGDREGAMASYRQAIRINPFAVEPHGNLGSLLASAGKWDEAITELTVALQLNPAYAEAHQNLANALVQVGRDAEARNHYEAAIRLKPDMAQAHYNYARLLARLGDTQAARAQAQEALARQPDYPDAAEFLKTLPPAPAPDSAPAP